MKNKDYVIKDFMEMIEKSWTYEKMTEKEKNRLKSLFLDTPIIKSIKGNYNQRWEMLQAIYHSYLIGIGYSNGNTNWRDN